MATLTTALRTRSRVLLPNVPRVGYYQGGGRCPEDVPFPACLSAALHALGQERGYRLLAAHNSTWQLDNTYTYLIGVSGCAFQFSWMPDWHAGYHHLLQMSEDPAEPLRRAYEAAGFGLKVVDLHGRQHFQALYREVIRRSLEEQGRPVIAFGVVGPLEACLVTGFDEDGDVLIGWSFFQDCHEYTAGVAFEPSGEFRKRNWFDCTRGLLLFDGHQSERERAVVIHSALDWALQLMRRPRAAGNRWNGLAAYAAWAGQLLQEPFPAGQDQQLACFMAHDEAVSTVAESRWYAARFLEQIAEDEPALEEELLAAAQRFDAEHQLMWEIWGLVGGSGRSGQHVQRFADPAVRRAIAALILRARDEESLAASSIERVLAKINIHG